MLLNNPVILIVDETATNFHAESAEVSDDLLENVLEEGRAVILTTRHDQRLSSMSKVKLELLRILTLSRSSRAQGEGLITLPQQPQLILTKGAR
jgi:ABC-type ATPase involved in cell division